MFLPIPSCLRKKWEAIPETQKKVFRNVMWALVGKIVGMLGALFVGVLVGRYLGPKNYGLMQYVISYVVIFEILSRFGLTNITIRELSRHPEQKNAILGTCFCLRLFFALVAYLGMLASLLIRREDAWTIRMIMVYGTCLLIYPFEIIPEYFTSIVRNEFVVKSQILRTCIGMSIKLVLLYVKAPLECFILAATFDFYLLTGGFIRSYQRHVGRLRDWTRDFRRVPFLVSESFPVLLSGAAVIIYQRINVLMLKNMLDESSAGYFATAGTFLSVVLFLPTVLVQSISPLLVRVRERNQARYELLSMRMIGGVTWIAMFMSIGIALTAQQLVLFTYGQKFLPAVPVLQILIWKTVGQALATSGAQVLIVEGLQKWAAIKHGIACVVCIIANWLLIPRYGAIGSAWATILAIATSVFLGNYIIPSYRHVLRLQVRAVVWGWMDLWEYGMEFVGKRNRKMA